MQTSNEIIERIKPAEILVQSSNYVQYINQAGQLCEAQKDYQAKKWYNFKTSGRSDSPKEEFLNWIK